MQVKSFYNSSSFYRYKTAQSPVQKQNEQRFKGGEFKLTSEILSNIEKFKESELIGYVFKNFIEVNNGVSFFKQLAETDKNLLVKVITAAPKEGGSFLIRLAEPLDGKPYIEEFKTAVNVSKSIPEDLIKALIAKRDIPEIGIRVLDPKQGAFLVGGGLQESIVEKNDITRIPARLLELSNNREGILGINIRNQDKKEILEFVISILVKLTQSNISIPNKNEALSLLNKIRDEIRKIFI